MQKLDNGLYVGCGLTQASEEFKEKVKTLKIELEGDYDVLGFLGLVDGTPLEVFRWDIEQCVGKCSAMLAIADEPSIGLGWQKRILLRRARSLRQGQRH